MNGLTRNLVRLTLIVLIIGTMLVGCGPAATPTEPPEEPTDTPAPTDTPVPTDTPAPTDTPDPLAEQVELTWYFPALNPSGLTDLEIVMEEANNIILEEINATVTLIPVGLGEYNDKMNAMAASGDPFDLAYTSWWTFQYFDQAPKGAFHPLTDLLDQYAPTIREELPDYVWQANTVGGEIYGVPHWENAAGPSGAQLLLSHVEEYDIDTDAMDNYDDIEPFLASVNENEPDLFPHVIGPGGFWEHVIKFNDMERFDAVPMLGFRRDEGPASPINLYATEAYEEYCAVLKNWWDAGYINDSAPTGGNTTEIINAGKAGSIFNRNMIMDTGTLGGREYLNVKFGTAILNTNAVLAHQTAVGRTSENPERAVMLLELIRTNQELFRLMTYGIEGEHYELDDDNRLTRIAESGYNLVFDWPFGDAIHDGYRPAGEDPAYMDNFEAALEAAEPSMILGFVFDPEPVSAELAQVQAIVDQYEPQLSTGAGDYETLLPEFLEQLEAAGINNIIAEMEEQVTAWQGQ